MSNHAFVPVALRVFGDALEPEEVSALLGAEPTRCHRKGDECTTGPAISEPTLEPTAESTLEPTGAWILESALGESVEIEEHVEALLAQLSNDSDEWSSLTSRFSASILCRVCPARHAEGFELSPRLAQSLAERGLVISVEFRDPMDTGHA